MLPSIFSRKTPYKIAISISLLSAFSLPSRADTACESTLSGGGLIDVRSFPTTTGDTTLYGRTDGNPSPCTIFSTTGVSYTNGLTIFPAGTDINFRRTNVSISGGLTVDNANNPGGQIAFYADNTTAISGDINVINQGDLKFVLANSQSSTTRLNLRNAYVNLDDDSVLNIEYKIGDSTGDNAILGSISGTGDTYLTNTGKTADYASLIINNTDGKDYSYSGDIYYTDQSTPLLVKNGSGTYSFSGDVKKTSGDTLGLTDGFSRIEINGGALEITTDAFVYGTKVDIFSGALIFNQSVNGTATGARLQGQGSLYKRGTSVVTLNNIGSDFKGNIFVESGTLALAGSSSLALSRDTRIYSGATLDVSNANSTLTLRRLYGSGTLALGSRNRRELIALSPGDGTSAIGVFNVSGGATLDVSGALLNFDLDATKGAGNTPGITHDQVAMVGGINFSTEPVIKLFDTQQGTSPSALLNGREFTIITANSGLSSLSTSSIIEDTNSFHAFIGAAPEKTRITDSEVSVVFGIKTVQQVANTLISNNTNTGSNANSSAAVNQYLQKATGLGANQAPTAAQLESHPLLNGLTIDSLIPVVNNNNPEAYSSNMTIGLEYQDLISNITMNHTRGSATGFQSIDGDHQTRDRYWLDVSYVDGHIDGESDHTGDYQYHLAGMVTGVDLIKTHSDVFGIFASIGSSKMSEHDNIQQTIDTDALNIGVYQQHNFNSGIDLHSVVMGFYHDSKSERSNLTTHEQQNSKSIADYSANGVTLGVNASKYYNLNNHIRITPNAGVDYSYLNQGSIKEKNGGIYYDYQIDATPAESIILSAGLDTSILLSDTTPIFFDARIRYEFDAYANKNQTHDIDAGLAGQEKTTFVGQNRGEHGVIVGAGLGGKITNNLTISGGLLYSHHSNGNESSATGNLTYQW